MHQRRRAPLVAVPSPARAPRLQVVVAPRRALHWVVVGVALIFAMMLGAAWFQTQLAQRQVQLDQLDRDMRAESKRHITLRAERAELLAAPNLFAAAPRLGLGPAGVSRPATIDAELIALVEMYDPRPSMTPRQMPHTDELARIGGVKAAVRPRQ